MGGQVNKNFKIQKLYQTELFQSISFSAAQRRCDQPLCKHILKQDILKLPCSPLIYYFL